MGNRKKLARFLLQTALLFLPVSYAAEASILYVQSVFTKRIEYAALDREDDWTLPDRMFCGEIVNASEDGGQNFSQIRTKSLDAMTSGRVTLWKTYIRKFLQGDDKRAARPFSQCVYLCPLFVRNSRSDSLFYYVVDDICARIPLCVGQTGI